MSSSASHPRRWLILLTLCLSTLVLTVDNQVLTVAIPTLVRDLGADAQDIQWITDAYILACAGLLLTAGSLSDRYGRRRLLVIGLVVFALASLVAAAATSPGQLIAGRALMGVGTALVLPSTLSILITVFTEEERRTATSAWSAVAMLGMIGGPILGGALLSGFGWNSVFLINIPIAALAIVAALWLMPESKGPARKADPLGAVLSVIGLTALVWAIIELPVAGLTAPGTLLALAVAVVALAAFAVWELKTPSPMVPLSLYRNRDFSGGSFALVLTQIGLGGLVLVLTQYLQFVLGYTPTEAGTAMVPMAVATIAANALGATLGRKLGNRTMTAAGLAVVAAGFGLMASLAPDSGFAVVAASLAVFGIGAGLAQPAAVAALMGAVPPEHAGVGSAVNDTMQQAGGALGVAVLGSVLAGAYTASMPDTAPEPARASIGEALAVGDPALTHAAREAFTSGMATTSWATAALVLAAAVLALFVMKPSSRKETREGELV
ncbi:MFS transporter [Amycolatopsis sp. 195334CR]|uniref:MFS transporter n=1 Tax=Amycolatopsis sp. 195334CR TaxID=2814588 RepID=UPI001A8D7863|nr:MFS transporter [Amycolatopsis sp. 195334CR]MBN6042085.1 MFS transporter [Amycolatopsis sp. 195334CR]